MEKLPSNLINTQYPPNTLYQICCGILRYIWELKPQLDIFRDAAFASFHQTLDAEMECLKAGGLGVHTKQAKAITPDEEKLWQSTLVYLCGTYIFRSQKCKRVLRLETALILTSRTRR